MKKNDITYEYRVFTHRPVDIETMEVGRCTSKTIKELKSSDKVDGRFFHTSDSDEWFFCWNGNLQKLNLKGDADVNSALEEVNRLIAEANIAVEEAKETATAAVIAADAATAAVESIDSKADKTEVEAVTQAVELKADKTAVDTLTTAVDTLTTAVAAKVDKTELDAKADKSVVEDLVSDVASKADADYVRTLSDKVDAIKLDGYATESFVGEEIAKIEIPTVPKNVSEFENDAKYLTIDEASSMFAPIDSEGGDMGEYATKKYVDDEIALKQDKIDGLDEIRSGAALGATALQSIPAEYVTETELAGMNYATVDQVNAKQDAISDLETIRLGAAAGATALQSVPAEYVTETELDGLLSNSDIIKNINEQIATIDAKIGEATELTNTILA